MWQKKKTETFAEFTLNAFCVLVRHAVDAEPEHRRSRAGGEEEQSRKTGKEEEKTRSRAGAEQSAVTTSWSVQ